MVDQDNWIIWMDKSIQLTAEPASNPTINQLYRIEFNKRFPMKLEYRNSTDNLPNKSPFMIIHHNAQIGNTLGVSGYVKMSYKDL